MSELTDTLTAIRPLLDRAVALATPPPDLTIPVNAGASLQAAIDAAPSGSTLALEPGVYLGTPTYTKAITIQPRNPVPPGRATDAGVWIRGTDHAGVVLGADVVLRGVGHLADFPTANLLVVTGERFTLDRCVVLGGPSGAHRGVLLNGNTAALLGCRIDEIWQYQSEAQAVYGDDGTRNVLIDDCYLGGASQSVMFGGADSRSPDRVPTGIVIRRSTLAKNPAWLGKGAYVKTAFELKSAIGVHLVDCALEGAGTSQQQGAFLIVLKSLNQNGRAPWSTVADVLIERCTARLGGGCVRFVGNDGANPSQRMSNITLRNVTFTEIDPALYPGSPGRAFEFQTGPIDVTLDHVTTQGKNLAAAMYFAAPQPVRLVLRNVALPASYYGIKIDAGGTMPLQQWAPDSVVENVTIG